MAQHQLSYQPTLMEGVLERAGGVVQFWLSERHTNTRRLVVGAILTMALVAFEVFNFDTTEYALENLLGTVSFVSVRWATILAIAFCGIDFAGLARLLTGDDEANPLGGNAFLQPSYLLMGAWLLGGAMNAIMTWWSISLALMDHNLGNEVLTRAQLLKVVPIFVAVLVWTTRILIISSFITAANRTRSERSTETHTARRPAQPLRAQPQPAHRAPSSGPAARQPLAARARENQDDDYADEELAQPAVRPTSRRPNGAPPSRPTVRRPPASNRRPAAVPVQMRRNPSGSRRKLV